MPEMVEANHETKTKMTHVTILFFSPEQNIKTKFSYLSEHSPSAHKILAI